MTQCQIKVTDKPEAASVPDPCSAGSAMTNQNRQGDDHKSSTGSKYDGSGKPAAIVVTFKPRSLRRLFGRKLSKCRALGM